jgi:hypothetical protein
MPAIPSAVKIGAVLVVLLIVGAILWAVRAELIDKGENIIKAQDNAALVKAQQDQAKRDAVLIASQNAYINDLQNAGTAVKEKIRVVQAPCVGDGRDDPRLGDTVDWLRAIPAGGISATGGSQPQTAVPPPRLPAAKR